MRPVRLSRKSRNPPVIPRTTGPSAPGPLPSWTLTVSPAGEPVSPDGDEPPLSHAPNFSEHIAQMPLCYQPNDRQRPRPQAMTRAEVGLPEDAVVLCGASGSGKS